jgi:hypothetical protein
MLNRGCSLSALFYTTITLLSAIVKLSSATSAGGISIQQEGQFKHKNKCKRSC